MERLSTLATALVFAAVAVALLLAAGRPLATDDTWWHLAHGAAYAQQGPWLDGDPLLFTAPGAPAPASWLADLGLHTALAATGFTGLRGLHVVLVAAIAALAFAGLRRRSGSAPLAAAGGIAFLTLAGYRLVQLRPELLTLLATLLLAHFVLAEKRAPSWRRIAAVGVGCALWSNLHAGFVLAPVLLAVAAGSLLLAAPLRDPAARRVDLERATRLAAAFAAALLGSLLNPAGAGAYRPLLVAGGETPALGRVGDEWTPLPLLSWPTDALPGGGLAVVLVWSLLLAGAWIAWRRARGWRNQADTAATVDPAQLGLAVAALLAMLGAVRFLWLGIFPLLLVADALRAARWLEAPGPRTRGAVLGLSVLLALVLFRFGDGRHWLANLPRTSDAYAAPFHAARYFAHSTWLMADAGLEGRLFADYFLGGFHGYWLAPRVKSFVNGSLNVRPKAMAANLPLRARRGERPGESFLALLDRHRIDLYLGTRLPEEGPAGRPWFATTRHLEGVPDWIVVFRNPRSALYVRDTARNADNLQRLVAYYANQAVPFDPERGFDAARVMLEAPEWAEAHGLAPRSFRALVASRQGIEEGPARTATDRLASLYAVLGLYEPAIRLDRELAVGPDAGALPRRRLVWSLLRTGRGGEAFDFARSAAPEPEPASLWRPLAQAAGALRDASPREVVERSATLPFLTRGEAAQALSGFVRPKPRAPR